MATKHTMPTGIAPATAVVERFINAARRRLLVRSFLWTCLWAGLVGEGWTLGTILLNITFRWRLPVYGTIGILVLAILAAVQWRRMSRRAAAATADHRLGLKDRLASFLDFSRRGDIDLSVRDAQAAETAAAVAGIEPRRRLGIHPLLWSTPALFLVLSTWRYFYSEQFPDVSLTSRFSGWRAGQPEVEKRQDRTGGNPEPRATVATKTDEAGTEPDASQPAPERPPPETASSPKTSEAPSPAESPQQPPESAPSAAAGGRGKGTAQGFGEPAQLYSETIGKKLTPLAEGMQLSSPQTMAPGVNPLLRGRQVFNLIPGRSPAKTGTGEAEGSVADNRGAVTITVDFDAIPVEYREFVRRYFEQLQTGG